MKEEQIMHEDLKSVLRSSISENEIIDFIGELISIPSYHGIKNQETEVAEKIHDLFEKERIESEIINVADRKCNVIYKKKEKRNVLRK